MIAKIILSAFILSAVNLNGIEVLFSKSNTTVQDKSISNQLNQNQEDYPVSGEIRRTYKLAPNATIEISGIEGSVEVKTTTEEGSAEIHFVRQAKTQADYDCETIVVQHAPTSLVVHHQTKNDKQCEVIQAREQMKLVVPQSANLNFKNIEGSFATGATNGFLRLNNIEGSVRIEQTQSADISSVESDLSLNVGQVSSQGISIHNIEGVVELGITKNLNADLTVKGNSGNIKIDIPNAQAVNVSGRKNYQLQIGTGGSDISISNIEGGVKIRGI